MQKYISIVVFLMMVSFFASAQLPIGYELRQTMDLFNTTKFVSGDWKKQLSANDIQGSPFLNDDFINGTIFTTQKQQYNDIPLRYNIYNDELEFKNPSGEILAMNTPEVVEIAVFGDNKLTYSGYLEGNKTKTGFFVIIEPGKAALLAKKSIFFIEATLPAAYKDAEPAKLKARNDVYYIKVGDFQALPADNKKNLVAAFPDNQDKIEAFISKNKVKLNKPESIAEVVKYYNSL